MTYPRSWIRRIGVGVGTTLDIFQNIIFIPYLEYGVLSLSGGVLSFIICGLCQGSGRSLGSACRYEKKNEAGTDSLTKSNRSTSLSQSNSKIKAVVLPPTIIYTQTPNKDTLFSRWVSIEEESQSLSSKAIKDLYGQFADKWVYAEVRAKEELIKKVCVFRYELLKSVKDEDEDSVEKLLEVEGWNLFKIYSDEAAMLELFELLEPSPNLAIKVIYDSVEPSPNC
ncbi:hypothetical protein Tco_1162295 [Tanacetum coccineum]